MRYSRAASSEASRSHSSVSGCPGALRWSWWAGGGSWCPPASARARWPCASASDTAESMLGLVAGGSGAARALPGCGVAGLPAASLATKSPSGTAPGLLPSSAPAACRAGSTKLRADRHGALVSHGPSAGASAHQAVISPLLLPEGLPSPGTTAPLLSAIAAVTSTPGVGYAASSLHGTAAGPKSSKHVCCCSCCWPADGDVG